MLLLLAFVAVPPFAWILVSASRERTAACTRIERDAAHLARLVSHEHARQIAGARTMLETLATHPSVWPRAGGTCPDFFPALVRGNPYIANLGLLDSRGRVRCSVAPPSSDVDMSGIAVFRRALVADGVQTGDYQIGLIVHRPVLLLMRALRRVDHSVGAVLFAALELGWFSELAAQAELPADTTFSLVDRGGRVLATSRPPERWVGRVLPELRDPTLRAGVHAALDETGDERLVAFGPLPGVRGVRVAISIARRAAFAAADDNLVLEIAGWLLVALVATVVAYVGTGSFVLHPLRSLVQASRDVGEGDLRARAEARTGVTEVDQLASAFNAMAEAVERRDREQTEAQAALRRSEEAAIALSRRLQTIREEEAGRIARDLHDTLGQELTAMKLEAAWIAKRLERDFASKGEERDVLGELGRHADGVIDLVRRLAAELRPGVLDRLGLAAAVEWQAREMEKRTGIRCVLELELEPGDEPDPDVACAVFRIAQEALTNVSRHAGATTVRVRLCREGQSVALSVRDDGCGIPPHAPSSESSLGLAGMRERARLVGGELQVTGEAGRGTLVEARVPALPAGLER